MSERTAQAFMVVALIASLLMVLAFASVSVALIVWAWRSIL